MIAVISIALALVVVGAVVGYLWMRRQVREAKSAAAVQKALRRVAEDRATAAQAESEHYVRVSNALYVRLREEDRREVDEIVSTGSAADAAEFLRRAWDRASGSPDGGRVQGAAVPGATAPAADRDD